MSGNVQKINNGYNNLKDLLSYGLTRLQVLEDLQIWNGADNIFNKQ